MLLSFSCDVNGGGERGGSTVNVTVTLLFPKIVWKRLFIPNIYYVTFKEKSTLSIRTYNYYYQKCLCLECIIDTVVKLGRQ